MNQGKYLYFTAEINDYTKLYGTRGWKTRLSYTMHTMCSEGHVRLHALNKYTTPLALLHTFFMLDLSMSSVLYFCSYGLHRKVNDDMHSDVYEPNRFKSGLIIYIFELYILMLV